MASIVKRRKKFSVVYSYKDSNGQRRQKWETFSTMTEAKKRKLEVESQQLEGTFRIPDCSTLDDLLKEYVQTYGVNNWALSTYESRVSLISNYVSPIIGDMKLADITPRVMDQYYRNLLQVKSVSGKFNRAKTEYVTPHRVREIHKILRNAFDHAVRWEMMSRNPAENATLPKETHKQRSIWTADDLMHALEICDDDLLYLAINVAFACSLRMGEMLGLTWDCVEISEEAINNGEAYIYINKELQRVSRDALEKLDDKDVIYKFPSVLKSTHTRLILKTPKTESSVRKVFLPKTVAELLVKQKAAQEGYKELFGSEYVEYNLVFTSVNGRPVEGQFINHQFKNLIKKGNLPEVVFHSLRHSSITYKLKLNGGDMKSVQGDSGHAQMKMVADVYSHIIDEDRRINAQKFEDEFYSGRKKREQEAVALKNEAEKVSTESAPATKKRGRPRKATAEDAVAEGTTTAKNASLENEAGQTAGATESDQELLLKLLQKPEMAELLKTLAKSL